jgi:hypothetical protein
MRRRTLRLLAWKLCQSKRFMVFGAVGSKIPSATGITSIDYVAVYTITHRKLADPTARRLENFWWHVWGSDRNRLSGKQLARLFEDISKTSYELPARRPDPDERMNAVSSSSSKPPPKQSILKKPRAPSSTSGPRPTARFASPPRPGIEDANDSGASSGSVTATTQISQGSSSSSEKGGKKSVTQSSKQYVASTSVSKRRPQVIRRPSSQTSGASDTSSREAPSSASTFRSQGSSRSSQQERSGMSAKAAGKRPIRPGNPQSSLLTGSLAAQSDAVVQHSRPSGETRENAPEYESTSATRTAEKPASTANIVRRGSDQRTPVTSAMVATSGTMADPPRSLSSPRRRETADGRLPSQGLTSSSVAGTSKVDVRGTFDFEDPATMLASTAEAHDVPDSALPSRPSAASLRDLMFTPTAPSPAPAVPLGRSKSQLTLLLAREREKLGGDLPSPRRRDTIDEEGTRKDRD